MLTRALSLAGWGLSGSDSPVSALARLRTVIKASETAAGANCLQQRAAAGAGETLPDEPVPHLRGARGPGSQAQPAGAASAGQTQFPDPLPHPSPVIPRPAGQAHLPHAGPWATSRPLSWITQPAKGPQVHPATGPRVHRNPVLYKRANTILPRPTVHGVSQPQAPEPL